MILGSFFIKIRQDAYFLINPFVETAFFGKTIEFPQKKVYN